LAYAFESNLAGESGFRAFWLSPLVLACAVSTLEMGLAASSRAAQVVATLVPLGLIVLALAGPGTTATQRQFLLLLESQSAGPAALTAGALAVYYAWAWLRGVQLAELGFVAAMALAAMIDSSTADWRMLTLRNLAPVGAVVVLQVVLSIRRDASWRMLLVVLLATAAASWPLRELPIVRSGSAPLHSVLLAMLVIGLTFDDRLARGLRRAAGALIPALALLSLAADSVRYPAGSAAMGLIATASFAALSVIYWRRERTDVHLQGAIATIGLFAATLIMAGYGSLARTPLSTGREWLAAGFACLATGLLISLAKSGLLHTGWRALFAWNQRFRESV
jgi:hypothetical protein